MQCVKLYALFHSRVIALKKSFPLNQINELHFKTYLFSGYFSFHVCSAFFSLSVETVLHWNGFCVRFSMNFYWNCRVFTESILLAIYYINEPVSCTNFCTKLTFLYVVQMLAKWILIIESIGGGANHDHDCMCATFHISVSYLIPIIFNAYG